MTRRFDFDDYKIVFNGHHFRGDGHLIGLPRYPESKPKDKLRGRVMVASRPHEISRHWLSELARLGGITINGTIEDLDGSTIKLQNGVLIEIPVGLNRSSGMYVYTFEFEVIDPPL